MDEEKLFSEIHKIDLKIYKSFKEICEKNNLRFFAISGTTIGVALWEGFIPWDDDMDIAMPAEDYDKFVKICKKGLPKELGFYEYFWFGGKLFDTSSMFTGAYYLSKPDSYTGVFIDIVPLIALPNDKYERESFIERVHNFHNYGLLYERYGDKDFSEKNLKDELNYLKYSYKFGDTDFVMDISDPRYVLEAKGFLNPILKRFEDTEIPTSSNYENDLKIQYAHLTKYPPKEQRGSLHQLGGILDTNKSLFEYQKEYKKIPNWIKEAITAKDRNEHTYLKSMIYYQDLIASEKNKKNKSSRIIKKVIRKIFPRH